MANKVLPISLNFLDNTYKHTAYEDKEDAERTYRDLRAGLPTVCEQPDGKKLIQKFLMLGKTVSTEGTFKDMVKIIWRMVKPMSGTPIHKLSLFLISVATVCVSLESGPLGGQTVNWLEGISEWLGVQLTIGGKGCTGEGEGSVMERIQRFFSTPYLHDFD